jgi:hypothetical protein
MKKITRPHNLIKNLEKHIIFTEGKQEYVDMVVA